MNRNEISNLDFEGKLYVIGKQRVAISFAATNIAFYSTALINFCK